MSNHRCATVGDGAAIPCALHMHRRVSHHSGVRLAADNYKSIVAASDSFNRRLLERHLSPCAPQMELQW